MYPVTIIEAKKKDATCIAKCWQEIDNAASERPFGGDDDSKIERALDIIIHAINSPSARILVAKIDSKIVGTITGHVYNRPAVRLSSVGVIYSLWVSTQYRKQGIGQSLLDSIEQQLTFMGAQSFQVGWDTANIYASKWWQKRGYQSYETIASKQAPAIQDLTGQDT